MAGSIHFPGMQDRTGCRAPPARASTGLVLLLLALAALAVALAWSRWPSRASPLPVPPPAARS